MATRDAIPHVLQDGPGHTASGVEVLENDRYIADAVDAVLPVGTPVPTFRGSASPGFLFCDGSAVSRTTYAALFAAIGTVAGNGDGSSTFNLPDLRGRFLMGVDGSAGRIGSSPDSLGNTGGEELHVLTVAELASHAHVVQAATQSNATSGSGLFVGVAQNSGTTAGTTQGTGSDQGHNNLPPYVACNWQIKT